MLDVALVRSHPENVWAWRAAKRVSGTVGPAFLVAVVLMFYGLAWAVAVLAVIVLVPLAMAALIEEAVPVSDDDE